MEPETTWKKQEQYMKDIMHNEIGFSLSVEIVDIILIPPQTWASSVS